MLNIHVAFMTCAVIAGIAVAAAGLGLFGRVLRRNRARLADCGGLGVSVAAGLTAWFGGIEYDRIAAAAAPAHTTVAAMLASTFAVLAVVVTVMALVISALAGQPEARDASAARTVDVDARFAERRGRQ